jgi:hypothetical protein
MFLFMRRDAAVHVKDAADDDVSARRRMFHLHWLRDN